MDASRKTYFSLRRGLTAIAIICWIVPIAGILIYSGVLLNNTFTSNVCDSLTASTESAVHMSEQRITAAITASREATFDRTVYEAWQSYRQDGNDIQLYQELTVYLSRKYDYNDSFKAVFLHIFDAPQPFFSTTPGLSTRTKLVSDYQAAAMDDLLAKAAEMGTEVRFFRIGEDLYMVRNLVDASFQPYGVLVMLCDEDVLFSSFCSLPELVSLEIRLDGAELSWATEEAVSGPTLSVQHQSDGAGVPLSVTTVSTYTDLFGSIPQLRYALITVTLLLIPLLALIFWMFYRHVTRPIDVLVDASSRVAEGQRGYRIEEMPQSVELRTLTEHFNTMSVELKRQFDLGYLEQQALQDARIKALRSQINPHFLNNTLEIINWEARLADDTKVSLMIEALSTMLGAALGRDGRDQVPLREELTYVGSYLYIIRQRLGDRLTVGEDIPEEVREAIVPRFILQPLVENAVDHGVSRQASGTLELHARREGDQLVIEVAHDGHLSDEDLAHISRLLGDDTAPELVSKVGIRNVSQRLRLLYGDRCSLSITEPRPSWVVSRVTLPWTVAPSEAAAAVKS